MHDGAWTPSARQRELFERLPSPEAELKDAFGIGRLLLGRTGRQAAAAVLQPTCNIAGITAGYQGPGSKTVIPAAASAKLDFRLLPGQDPAEIASGLRRHLDAGGFGDVEIEVLGAEPGAVGDPDGELVRLAAASAAEVYGKPPVVVPLTGGTTPMYLFTERGVPVVAPGVGFGSSNLAHSPNENVRLGDLQNAARHLARLLALFGES